MVITEAGQAAELESLTINLHTAKDDDNNNYNYGQEALQVDLISPDHMVD